MSQVNKRRLLILGVCAVALGLTSCGPPTDSGSNGGQKKACDLRPYRPDSPHISSTALRKGRVETLGKVFVICNPPPERHHLTIWLERKSETGWETMAMSETKQTPTKKGSFFVAVYPDCKPGKWRTRAEATGRLRHRPFKFEDTSKTLTISQGNCNEARKKARRGR